MGLDGVGVDVGVGGLGVVGLEGLKSVVGLLGHNVKTPAT